MSTRLQRVRHNLATEHTHRTVAHHDSLSMGFPRQKYWGKKNGLPFPTPGDLTNPGIKPTSSALAGNFFIGKPPGKPIVTTGHAYKNFGEKKVSKFFFIKL